MWPNPQKTREKAIKSFTLDFGGVDRGICNATQIPVPTGKSELRTSYICS